MITLVCGFGRCGSSLTMQMLWRGGMPIAAAAWPYFEDTRVAKTKVWDWIDEHDGGALKVLHPLTYRPPEGPEYRTIWLDRDPKQQAKSWSKLNHQRLGHRPRTKVELKLGEAKIKRERASSLALCRSLSKGRVLELRFEKIIESPDFAAEVISEFCGGLDAEAMAAGVLMRGPDCAQSMIEPALEDMGPDLVDRFNKRRLAES